MKILMVGSECAPFVKVGGLADVLPALSRALAAQGHAVRICLPLYAEGRYPDPAEGAERVVDLELPMRPARRVRLRVRPGPPPIEALVLVDAPELFGRAGVYDDPATGRGHVDNCERFAVLSAAAAACAAREVDGFAPEIVHCHDHQAGLVPAFLRFGPPGLRADRPVATVFTIHNLGYQGLCETALAATCALDGALMRPLGPLEFHGLVSMMKAGLALADRLTTVSPTYSEEIRTPEFGEGLEGVLEERGAELGGILNGVDLDVWNPAKDPLIPARYSARNPANKLKNRRALLEACGLAEPGEGTAVLGMVSRLAPQKGFDLLLATVDSIMEMDVRLAVLGTGDEKIEKGLADAARRWPGRIALVATFDEALAHLIEAGSDMFLMPSRYEPCGLNQMYSLIYGSVPVVRATGGLADTVVDVDEDPQRANGFVFRLYEPIEFLKTVRRAVRAFGDRPLWRELVGRGMAADFSWARAARRYAEVYESALAEARRGR